MKFYKPLLRRLAWDLTALLRLIDMLVQESERFNYRTEMRRVRQLARERAKKAEAESSLEGWPEPLGPDDDGSYGP